MGTIDNTFEQVDITGWDEEVRNFLSAGERMVGITGYQAMINDGTGGAFTVLKDAGTNKDVSFLFGGGGSPDVGDPAYHLPSIQFSSSASFDAQKGILSADFMPASGGNLGNPMGVVLHNGTVGGTVTRDSHDNGASSANGYSVIYHKSTTTDGTSWQVDVEHSTDDSAWSTLVTFAFNGDVVTGSGIESYSYSGTGTVNRYVRVVVTNVGVGGSFQFAVTFARN